MSALTVSQDPEQSWDDLVRFWEEMEWPEGSKVEIIEGIVTVSPAPAYRHNVIAARIQRRLYSAIPEHWEIFQTLAIAVPSRLGMLIPDLMVAPVHDHPESETHIPAGLAELVFHRHVPGLLRRRPAGLELLAVLTATFRVLCPIDAGVQGR